MSPKDAVGRRSRLWCICSRGKSMCSSSVIGSVVIPVAPQGRAGTQKLHPEGSRHLGPGLSLRSPRGDGGGAME
jgi:hypothetical protein